jgi:hypothetical protein
MTKWILIIIMVLLLPIVMAQEKDVNIYDLDEEFDLSIHLTNKTGDVKGATCKTQIRYSNSTVKDEIIHDEVGGGWYNATYNSSESGTFLCRHNCTQGTKFASETCDFKIKSDDIMIMTSIITILAIGLISLIIGFWKKDVNFGFISGFIFCIVGVYLFTTGFPNFNNWVSNSLSLILAGLGSYILFRSSVESLEEADEA